MAVQFSVLLTLRKCGLSAERIKREKRGKEGGREGERALSALANVPAAADDDDADDDDAECESSSLLKKH